METFNAIPDSQLSVKVRTNTTKRVFTKIYDVFNGTRIKPHLVESDLLENGSIDLIGNTFVWKSLGHTNQFQGHLIEIYTIVHNLPANVTSDAAVKEYILENVAIDYELKDDGHEEAYSFNKNDKVSLLIERTGIIFKYIQIQ